MNKTFLILAAGKGTRMLSAKPKVMHEIAFKPLVYYPLKLAQANSNEVILISHSDYHELDLVAKKYVSNLQIAYQNERLGTGHAVKIALDRIKPDQNNLVFIIYGDTPFIDQTIISALEQSCLDGASLSLVGFTGKEGEAYGRLITEGNKLTKIVENSEATPAEKEIRLYNSGVMAIRADILCKYINQLNNNNSKKEYFLTDLIEILNQENLQTSFVTSPEEKLLGINNKAELARADKIMQNQLKENALQQGVTLIAADSIFLNPEIEFGQDVIIEPGVIIKGKAKIADQVLLKAYSVIEDNISLDKGVVIGPFARIRPNSEISEQAKIGNFVEIKNSQISANSKINHLSYIGDSEIGENVNVGAGTITCNYDGFNKAKTIIEDDVFIGSNTALIAPLKIANGAIIAAGSTISQNVAENDLAIARAEQVNLADKANSFRGKRKNAK